MHAWARAALLLTAGFWLSVVTFEAVAIYGFGQFEHVWGRGPSLQVVSWVATGVAVVVLVGAVVGFRLGAKRGVVPGNLVALMLGALLTIFVVAFVSVLSLLPLPNGALNAASGLLLLATFTFALAFVSTRVRQSAA